MLLKKSSSREGFTLLEMGLVLFILVLIAGMAIPMTTSLLAQERLKGQARELQDYAWSARKLAVSENRPYQIILTEKGFSLEKYDAGENVVSGLKLASNVGYTVQRMGEKEFHKPAGEPWVFQPDGICEPIRVHFQSGNGWVEFAFNPLTARPRDETYYFP